MQLNMYYVHYAADIILFTLVAENGKKVTCFLTAGTRITKPGNLAITPIIDRVLVVLADLTEYHKLGGALQVTIFLS